MSDFLADFKSFVEEASTFEPSVMGDERGDAVVKPAYPWPAKKSKMRRPFRGTGPEWEEEEVPAAQPSPRSLQAEEDAESLQQDQEGEEGEEEIVENLDQEETDEEEEEEGEDWEEDQQPLQKRPASRSSGAAQARAQKQWCALLDLGFSMSSIAATCKYLLVVLMFHNIVACLFALSGVYGLIQHLSSCEGQLVQGRCPGRPQLQGLQGQACMVPVHAGHCAHVSEHCGMFVGLCSTHPASVLM